MWTAVKKDSDGIWNVRGTPLSPFQSKWANNEPKEAVGADCASISKDDGYKLKATNCLEPKKFFCMAIAPNCPHGYTWVPGFGKGRSCFKEVGPLKAYNPVDNTQMRTEDSIGDQICLKDNTRRFTPESDTDVMEIKTWVNKPDVKKIIVSQFGQFFSQQNIHCF
jgi:hypothetical protein